MIPLTGMSKPLKQHPIVTVCSSAAFYRQACEIKEKLEAAGLTVLIPETALRMKESNDFDVSHHKTWFANEGDYPEKARFIRAHFEEIVKGDAVLVLNYEKHGRQNYIGANVLMEMALAFFLKKPIFVLNDLPEDTAYEEELKGMLPILLHGKLDDLPKLLSKVTASA
jgi:hypothetical protein